MRTLLIAISILVSVLAITILAHNSSMDANATTMLFADNYSNAGWYEIGSGVTVNSLYFPGIVKFNNVAGGGGVDQNRVIRQLPAALPSGNWTADFEYKFTASSIPADLIFDLTTTKDDPQVQSGPNRILIEHGNGVDQLFITNSGSIGTDSAGISISPNVKYYARLAKTSTQLELFVFSDSARTINVPGSPVTAPILATDFNGNLNFLQHDGCTNCGNSRTLTAQITHTKIFVP